MWGPSYPAVSLLDSCPWRIWDSEIGTGALFLHKTGPTAQCPPLCLRSILPGTEREPEADATVMMQEGTGVLAAQDKPG